MAAYEYNHSNASVTFCHFSLLEYVKNDKNVSKNGSDGRNVFLRRCPVTHQGNSCLFNF